MTFIKPNILFLLLCIAGLTLNLRLPAQNDKSAGSRIAMLSAVMQKFHVRPRAVDDSLSHDVFDAFMGAVDPYKIILMKSDIENLDQYKDLLDDEMKQARSGFLDAFMPLYKERLTEAVHFLGKAAAKPLDLMKSDTLRYVSPDVLKNPADSNEQLKIWTRYLKSSVLEVMFDSKDLNDTIFKLSTTRLLKLEPSLRERARIKEQRWINNILDCPEGMENYITSLYLSTIAGCYDPHSCYFSPEEMKMFRSESSSQSYLFGFDVAENKAGNVYISEIVPGGPAWKSNQLNKGDVLTAVKWEGKNEVDLTWSSIDEVESLLSASIEKKLMLSVRKADGRLLTVALIKEKMRSQENMVRSYILEGEKKIGYICLPDFYTNDESNNMLGCANDVAKELIKLKKEGIGGLILDLQYNGGGSVREAVDLAGIFIEAGPVCIFNSRREKAYTLKDMNIGSAYDGPLVIMVNNYSASASEIVSGALQDYHRALIVGTPTYGKSTGQAILPMDTSLKMDYSNKKETDQKSGWVKVTTNQVYRITGGSHQKTGVQPDIMLPDPFYDETAGEKDEDFAFENDRINKKTYYTPFAPLPVDSLAKMSRVRIKNNIYLNECAHFYDSVHRAPETNYTVLTLNVYRDEEYWNFTYFESLDSLASAVASPFKVLNNAYDLDLLKTDEYFKTINESALKRLEGDVFLMETYTIMNDLIDLIKK